MDHVPGIGPHRVGMVTPSVGSPHNPTQFGSDSTLDAVSRHCEKELRCPIQSCLDAIKHCVHFRFGRFGDELLFGAQTYVLYVHFGSRPKWTCKVQHKGFVFFSHPNLFKIFPPWYGVGLYSLWMVLSHAMSIALEVERFPWICVYRWACWMQSGDLYCFPRERRWHSSLTCGEADLC